MYSHADIGSPDPASYSQFRSPGRYLPKEPQAGGVGLEAYALGFRANVEDDHENILLQFPAYDALFTYYKLKVEGEVKLEHPR